jgi:hypothetical protein
MGKVSWGLQFTRADGTKEWLEEGLWKHCRPLLFNSVEEAQAHIAGSWYEPYIEVREYV